MTVKLSREVYEGIEAVRQSGVTNMLDRPAVIKLCIDRGYYTAAEWIVNNKKKYARLIFEGPEVE